MKLIIGLGNPGEKYATTRHNIGYMAMDVYSKKNNLNFKLENKFDGLVSIFKNKNESIIMLKPVTFMNESGRSLTKVINYYKIPLDDILVIYDDMALDIGKLRLRAQGSAGGHNGIKSIINHLSTSSFKRVRVGIGKNDSNFIDYVLGEFSKDDRIILEKSFEKITEIINLFINNESFDKIMNKYNIS